MIEGVWRANDAREEPHADLRVIAAEARVTETACGDGAMVWRAWGSGRPLVLLHGGSGSWRHWARNIPFFAATRRVICPDLPGLGDSDMPPMPASPESIAEILRAGLGQILPQSGYDLVGFSFGALCAGHLAAIDTDRCVSLTIVGAGALGFPRSPTELVKVRALEGAEREAANRHNLAALMIADASRIDEVALAMQDLHTRRARFKSRGWAGTDSLRQAILRGRAPLGAIYGEQDAIARPHVGLRIDLVREMRQGARTSTIPGAGHWVAYEAADAFNAALSRILARDGGTS
ncbi:alpha/beta fold hydrolase [Roseomonas sp. PWR1]|uniref:Alpha/beta fold hydrolase n=1 Tax=Roseomonas nitratireducens TaxID=2820810 RepID=A0ABS4ASM3_9PROT|nr:alpha/beta fold hydrolase [Neoroseomonas nitratireducens]MBP0464364.1 alpha/beta fold hydrolase [Neoroseomonas nitratireducens]